METFSLEIKQKWHSFNTTKKKFAINENKKTEKGHPTFVEFGMISKCLYKKSRRNLNTVIKL